MKKYNHNCTEYYYLNKSKPSFIIYKKLLVTAYLSTTMSAYVKNWYSDAALNAVWSCHSDCANPAARSSCRDGAYSAVRNLHSNLRFMHINKLPNLRCIDSRPIRLQICTKTNVYTEKTPQRHCGGFDMFIVKLSA